MENTMRVTIVTALAALAMAIGTGTATAYPVLVGENEAQQVNYCADGLPVYRDSVTGTLYGDQDGNGVLAGTDCDWS
jgi:hypothetical protein